MKKQLFDLTLEEFLRVILDLEPVLIFELSAYDEEGKLINTQANKDENDKVITFKGTIKEFKEANKGLDYKARTMIEEELEKQFDYDIKINSLDIYNYLEHITNSFQTERIKIVLNQMNVFYLGTYLGDINKNSYQRYIDNGWEIPYRDVEFKGKNNKAISSSIPDYETMRNKFFLGQDYFYFEACSILKNKIEPTNTEKNENTPREPLEEITSEPYTKVQIATLMEILKEIGVSKANTDITKIVRLISFLTSRSCDAIYNEAVKGITFNKKYHQKSIDEINKILKDINSQILIDINKQY